MTEKYEKIDFYNLPSVVTVEFEKIELPDNSIVLTRCSGIIGDEPELERLSDMYGGTRRYSLTIPVLSRKIDCVVLIYRTSANHYVITGSNLKHTKTGYAKNLTEVGAFISRWFCRTLLEDN